MLLKINGPLKNVQMKSNLGLFWGRRENWQVLNGEKQIPAWRE